MFALGKGADQELQHLGGGSVDASVVQGQPAVGVLPGRNFRSHSHDLVDNVGGWIAVARGMVVALAVAVVAVAAVAVAVAVAVAAVGAQLANEMEWCQVSRPPHRSSAGTFLAGLLGPQPVRADCLPGLFEVLAFPSEFAVADVGAGVGADVCVGAVPIANVAAAVVHCHRGRTKMIVILLLDGTFQYSKEDPGTVFAVGNPRGIVAVVGIVVTIGRAEIVALVSFCRHD